MSAGADGTGPLLQVDKLTLKFRGLTAVDNVDLQVPPRAIFAVIGPNGAGKTSLFNAITGINEPTAGTVAFEGQDLRRPLTRRHYLRWGGVGLIMAVFCLLLASDVNIMWAAVIKQNFQTREQGFQVRQALADVGNYLAARPRIEQRAGRFSVVTHDGLRPFGSLRTLEEAQQRRAEVAADRDGSAAAARRTRVLAAFLGLLLGFAGAYAVWRQTRRTPSGVASRGIARTFQNIRLFQEMTVLENVLVGMDRHLRAPATGSRWNRRALAEAAPLAGVALVLVALVGAQRWEIGGPGLWGLLLFLLIAGFIGYLIYIARLGAFSRDTIRVEAAARAEAAKLLAFVGLADKQKERAKNLAYGDQRRLEIARALATRARLLLLDEPAAGMNPAETVSLMKLIRDIRDSGVTVLLIEHHMRVVMGISDRIAVLEYGRKIAEGTPEEIRTDPRVIEAYLGKEEHG